jgi:hypothetical protein
MKQKSMISIFILFLVILQFYFSNANKLEKSERETQFFKKLGQGFKNFAKNKGGNFVQNIIQGVGNAAKGVGNAVKGVGNAVKGVVQKVGDVAHKAVSPIFKKIQKNKQLKKLKKELPKSGPKRATTCSDKFLANVKCKYDSLLQKKKDKFNSFNIKKCVFYFLKDIKLEKKTCPGALHNSQFFPVLQDNLRTLKTFKVNSVPEILTNSDSHSNLKMKNEIRVNFYKKSFNLIMSTMKNCEYLQDELRNMAVDYMENVVVDEFKAKAEKKEKEKKAKEEMLKKKYPQLPQPQGKTQAQGNIQNSKTNKVEEKPKSSIIKPNLKKTMNKAMQILNKATSKVVSVNSFMKKIHDAMMRNYNPKFANVNPKLDKKKTEEIGSSTNANPKKEQPSSKAARKATPENPIACNCEGVCEGVKEISEYIADTMFDYVALKQHPFKAAGKPSAPPKRGKPLGDFLKKNSIDKVESGAPKHLVKNVLKGLWR